MEIETEVEAEVEVESEVLSPANCTKNEVMHD